MKIQFKASRYDWLDFLPVISIYSVAAYDIIHAAIYAAYHEEPTITLEGKDAADTQDAIRNMYLTNVFEVITLENAVVS